jgi:hypothetical protein
MSSVPIPPWNADGVLPPINADDPTSLKRSPYLVSLVDLVTRFGITPERCRILNGLVRLRAALHAAGFICGFQWLDGSFLEDVERQDSRAPRDIDVVTFVDIPPEFTMENVPARLLDHDAVKTEYHVDHYLHELSLPIRELVAWAAYWYGVWSHRRTRLWKGYLQIELDPAEDGAAAAVLQTLQEAET